MHQGTRRAFTRRAPDDGPARCLDAVVVAGGFAPVTKEVEAFDLEVDGALPASWRASTCATARTRSTADSPHWFFGDGMVHGVRLEGGKAVWYRNRYVRTAAVRRPAGFGERSAGRRGEPEQRLRDLARRQAAHDAARSGCPYELSPD